MSILGGRELELAHNHHNFAWKERHEGEERERLRLVRQHRDGPIHRGLPRGRPSARVSEFVDLTGARIRIRTRLIDCIFQSTTEQRASERAFHRALDRERKSDHSDDDDR